MRGNEAEGEYRVSGDPLALTPISINSRVALSFNQASYSLMTQRIVLLIDIRLDILMYQHDDDIHPLHAATVSNS